MAPSTEQLLTRWDWDPSILAGLVLFTALYAYVAGPLRRRHNLGPPVSRGRIIFFVVSQLVVFIALISPIDAIGDEYLFSAHMIQHLLLASLWPPLILLATPAWMVRPFFRWRGIAPIASFFTIPAIAFIAFNADMYLWHVPRLYDLTLRNGNVHILEHLSFMAFGVLIWWPVLSPIVEQRLSYPLQVLYLFAAGMAMMALSIVLTFLPIAVYTPYISAPRLWGISPVTDQQIGGLVMWYPGDLPYGIWLIVAFYRWFDAGGPTGAKDEQIEQGISATGTG